MNTSDAKLSLARLVGGGFIIVGSLIGIIGFIWLVRTAVFVSRAAKAPGTVIEMERSIMPEGNSTYHPIYTFADASGVIHTQRTASGSSGYTFEPGEKVTVLYDSSTPKHSEIDSFDTVWSGPLIITGFGLLFGGFASFWLLLATRARRLETGKYAVLKDGG